MHVGLYVTMYVIRYIDVFSYVFTLYVAVFSYVCCKYITVKYTLNISVVDDWMFLVDIIVMFVLSLSILTI